MRESVGLVQVSRVGGAQGGEVGGDGSPVVAVRSGGVLSSGSVVFLGTSRGLLGRRVPACGGVVVVCDECHGAFGELFAFFEPADERQRVGCGGHDGRCGSMVDES